MRLLNVAAIITLLLASAHFAQAQLQPTVDQSQYGWLEGTITNNLGKPIKAQPLGADGEQVKGVRQEAASFRREADTSMGGLYSVKNIKPGIYDLTLGKGWIDNQTPYCPERILGVIVKPGQRTVLNIVMDQGETYEEVGKPTFVTNIATNVSQQLEQMQKQIEELKAQVAALQQKLGTTPTLPAATPPTPVKP